MTRWPRWLLVAMDELAQGVAEVLGERHNARILEYHRHTSLGAADDETPWCASFVNWCLAQCWIKGTNSARARSFETWGQMSGPDVGAVAVLWRGSPGAATGHVGFLLGHGSGRVILLGGNQGNAVSVTTYPEDRVVCYRRPTA